MRRFARFPESRDFSSVSAATAMRRAQLPTLALFTVSCAFILIVNEPIASPIYRLPIEPALLVFTGAGLFKLRAWWRRARGIPSD
jgi:hypothetical protein